MRDKSSIMHAAQQFAAKGQIDKAISELVKLVDDRDGNILNSIGDLYLRKGDKKEAVEYFKKTARLYKEDGFYPKAIALYKKIINIVPTDADVLIAAAGMIAEKGLIGEAVENYLKAAEIYTQNGAMEKALVVYENALSLAPSNITLRTRITEIYLRMGLKERAAAAYSSIASEFMEKGEPDSAIEYYGKALDIDPGNAAALLGLSKLK